MLLGAKGCNNFLNNRTIDKPAYHTESQATGIAGHIEYTRYADNSQDVKIYPSWNHRYWSSELDQDLNGDGIVDRIRLDGPEFKMHRLTDLLVRAQDYSTSKEKFDEADKRLAELMKKYHAKKISPIYSP